MAGLSLGLRLGLLMAALPPLVAAPVGLSLAQKGVNSSFVSGTGFPVLMTEPSPGVFSSNYSEATFRSTGTTYWVTEQGNNSNDGLSAQTAWRMGQYAHDTAPAGSQIMFGAGRSFGSIVQTKEMSFIGIDQSVTFVGEILKNSDVADWGAFANGRQTVTLATGAVSYFVDLAQTRRVDEQNRALPQISLAASNTTAMTANQANTAKPNDVSFYGKNTGDPDPIASIIRSTPAVLGAAVPRDLAGKADTDLIMVRAGAPGGLVVNGTAKSFAKHITFVGGGANTTAVGTTVVSDNCRWLGGDGQTREIAGTSVIYNSVIMGCGTSGADACDYGGSALMVEINSTFMHGGYSGADNCSTIHGGAGLRINGTYCDTNRAISDNGGGVNGIFGSRCAGWNDAGARHIAGGDNDMHVAGLKFPTGSAAIDYMINTSTTERPSRFYDYDGSLTGKTLNSNNAAAVRVFDRNKAKDTSDATFARWDASAPGTLFKDLAGTQAAAPGDVVLRINVVGNPNEFIISTGAGSIIYRSDGTKHWLDTTGGNCRINPRFNDIVFDEQTNLLVALRSTDTTGYTAGTKGTVGFGIITTSSSTVPHVASAAEVKGGQNFGTPTYHVDGSATALNTRGSLQSTLCDGNPRVLGIKGANLGWDDWHRTGYLNIAGTGTQGLDGSIYAMEWSRKSTDANFRSRCAALLTKIGGALAV